MCRNDLRSGRRKGFKNTAFYKKNPGGSFLDFGDETPQLKLLSCLKLKVRHLSKPPSSAVK